MSGPVESREPVEPGGRSERPGTAPAGRDGDRCAGDAGRTRVPVRMCVRCCAITDAPVVVSVVHQGSGPGFTVYACQDCAPGFPPVTDVLSLPPGSRRDGGER